MIRTVNEIGRIPQKNEAGTKYEPTWGILKTVKALTLIENFPNCNQILHFHVYNLHKTCFLFLAFDLSLVLQHGHIISDVEKNNAHKEHRFCPILYFKLLGNDMGLNLTHNPLHVCDIIFQSLVNIFKIISKSLTNFF